MGYFSQFICIFILKLKMVSKIKMLRLEKQITQEEIALKLHMAQNTYSKYEAEPSKFTDEQLYILSEIFNKPIEELLSGIVGVNINNVSGVAYNSGELIYNSKELIDKLLLTYQNEIELLKNLLNEKQEIILKLLENKSNV